MKKKLLILLSLLFFSPFVINAEELKMELQKNWGGNNRDGFDDILQTKDGGYIALLNSDSTDIEGITNKGYEDAIILKYDKDFNVLWQKSWGGNSSDYLDQILLTEDGGFLTIGTTYSTDIVGLTNRGRADAIIVKFDKDGNMVWQKKLGGSNSEYFNSFIQTKDEGVIVIGDFESTDIDGLPNKGRRDAIMVKYDKDGNLLWQKSLGGNNYDEYYEVLETEDGGLIAFGTSNSTNIEGITNKGADDVIIIKYDKDGNLLWQKSWGGNSWEYINDVIQTEDGGFITVGSFMSDNIEDIVYTDNEDAVIIKYDKNGDVVWQKSWGGNEYEIFSNIMQTKDEGFIITGKSSSTDIEGITNKGTDDAIIVKYDKNGNVIWQTSYGDKLDQRINSAVIDKKGNLIVCIDSFYIDEGEYYTGEEDSTVISYDKDGELLWQKNWGGSGTDIASKLLETEDNELIVLGWTESSDIEGMTAYGSKDAFILKYSYEYNLENITTENGTSAVEQKGKYGIVTPTSNEGYEVDKIIIKDKDGIVLDVEVNKQEDGTYSFDLYTDVSVEVIYKEVIENPKTGILDVITIIFVGFAISISGFFIVKKYNERLEF